MILIRVCISLQKLTVAADEIAIEGLQAWNQNLNEEYRKLMEGADTGEEKDERMAEAFKYVKKQVADEGTSICDVSLRFANHLKTITDMVRDHASLTCSTDFCLDYEHQMPRSFLRCCRRPCLQRQESHYTKQVWPLYELSQTSGAL